MPAIPPDPFANADLLRIPVGGGSLHVERYGLGQVPIVLLHGFGTCGFLWRAVGPELAIAGARAFAIDLMGYGESDRPLGGGYSIAQQAEYVDRALTALRIASATIVGVDLGGAVALRLAATRPDRVDGLVLVNSLAPDACPGADIRQLPLSTARFLLRISRGVLGAAPVLERILERSVYDPAHMPARLVARYLAPYAGRDGVNHLLTLGRAVDGDDLEGLELEQVPARTLVVRGELDEFVEDGVAERLAATLPNARMVVVPGVARLVPEEAPDRLVQLILEQVGLREPVPEPAPEPAPAAVPAGMVDGEAEAGGAGAAGAGTPDEAGPPPAGDVEPRGAGPV